MNRKSHNPPEELWVHATYEQLADLREWIQSRMKQRHADSISAWLLSLGTDAPAEPHKRQLAFFRQILDEYGPPRPAIADGDDGDGGEPEPPSDVVTDPGPEARAPEPEPEGSSRTDPAPAEPAGRFHRA